MISGAVVVDASVVVEFLVDLGRARQAARVFSGLLAPERSLEIWAPDLVYAESASALRKLVQRKVIGVAAGTWAMQQLTRLPIMATGTAALMPEVWRMRGGLTAYDACYVALAQRLGATLVTADERLVRARRRDRIVLLDALKE
ncbi:MAG TPA: type II toxin-antitoxin system VapC family toxin [Candidatus Margulisiibacteriota bacterium]|nr:type II toxin-antitoxin system VapC family toxin [Candidatus Margulisiibacteriota bacterium]